MDRRRNKPSRPITLADKLAVVQRAAGSTGVVGEISERSTDVLRKHSPRGGPPQGSQRNPDIRNAVSHYVESLIRLYERTDPVRGRASEENKLEYARQAISIWWYLFGELLLWAQSHLAGYEIGRSNPDFMNKLAKMFGREIDVDSHVLEYMGLGFSWNRVNYDDPTMEKIEEAMKKNEVGIDDPAMRYLVRELLQSRSANSSFWRFPLSDALSALNLGHAEDIVRPQPIRRQGNPVQVRNWQIMALRHVYYHIGRGLKKYRALQLVGDELGQSPETLRAWEKTIIHDEDFMMQLHGAKLAGELEDEFDKHSTEELEKKYASQYHRHTSDIEYAKSVLRIIRSSPLKQVRQNLRHSRSPQAKKSGA